MNYLDVAVSCASVAEVIVYWGLNSQMAVNPMRLKEREEKGSG